MDSRYKSIRNFISIAMALALTAVLLWGIIDAGSEALWTSAAAIVGR
jgi:hypothetical protein